MIIHVLIGQTRGDELVKSTKIAIAASSEVSLLQDRQDYMEKEVKKFEEQTKAWPEWARVNDYVRFYITKLQYFETEEEEQKMRATYRTPKERPSTFEPNQSAA